MMTDNSTGVWSADGFTFIENALWQENRRSNIDLTWLEQSREDPTQFGLALHVYWQRRQASSSKSIPWERYDFFHDVLCHRFIFHER